MSFNGSGTFVINSSGQPVVANTVISSTVFNALTADLATGLSTCITKDGQTTPTANIPMGTFKFTNLGNGSAATDSATLGQVQASTTKLVTVSGTDTITGTMTPALTAYASGQMFYFVAGGANTGAVTLNIDGLGARNVTRHGSVALVAGDILSGEVCVVVYDGTRFQLLNPASYTNLNVTGVLSLAAGTALLPSLAFSGDTNTGLWSPAADTLAASTGGSERLRVDSSGNVGIGTASPGAKLTVGGNDQSNVRLRLTNTGSGGRSWELVGGYPGANNANFSIFDATASTIPFTIEAAAPTNAMLLNASGNLGIGTASPSDILTLAGGASGSYGLTINNAKVGGGTKAIFQYDATNQIALVGGNTTNGLAFQTLTTGILTTKAVIDASGNLGIGTASPFNRLVVSNGSSENFEFNPGSVALNGGAIEYINRATATTRPDFNFYIGTNGSHKFYTNALERMRITGAGNIVAGASAALATTATDGFLYVPTCAGTPTGTPTAITGMAPIVVNTTNNKLYFYSGGAWRDAGP